MIDSASTLPMFPLGTAFLPGDAVPLRVFEPRYTEMVRRLLAADSEMRFGTVLIERGREVGGDDVRRPFGVSVEIVNLSAAPEGGYSLVGRATSLLRVDEWLPEHPYPLARVSLLQVREVALDESLASRIVTLAQSARSLLAQYLEVEGLVGAAEPSAGLSRVASGQWLSDSTVAMAHEALWTVARHLPVGPDDRYAFLSTESLSERVQRVSETLAHAAEVLAFRSGGG